MLPSLKRGKEKGDKTAIFDQKKMSYQEPLIFKDVLFVYPCDIVFIHYDF